MIAIANVTRRTMPPMASSKSLTTAQNEHLRGVVRALVAGDFDGNASRAARAFGVTQSLVSEFLGGGRGAGPKLVQGVADYTGASIDALYGRAGVPAVQRALAVGRHPEWPAARDGALQRARTVRPADIERVADVVLPYQPQHLSPDFVLRLAEALLFAGD
jgi:hypothetical protein